MKKIRLFILTLITFITCINVYAADPVLVPVNSSGVNNNFEHYSYSSTQVTREGNDLYYSSTIKNNNKKASSICLEILLFNKEEKNIGVFNYNSSKDYESQFSSYKIPSGGTVAFRYKIIDKYLANKDKDSLNDVAYFSVLSDNEYCKIGGYDNYYGKSFKSIVSNIGVVHSGTKFDALISKINKYIPIDGLNVGFGVGTIIIIVSIVIGLAIWFAFGAFLNKLHNAMYRNTTGLVYVPIANSYLCVKMAFGKIVAFSYLGVCLLGGLLTLVGFGFIIILAGLVMLGAFILDIVKLITGNYDLCNLDNIKNNVVVDNFNNNGNNNGFINNNTNNMNNNNQTFNNQNQVNEYGYSQDDNVKESLMGVSTGKSLEEDNTSNFDNNMNVNTGSSNTDNNQTNNDDSEESDLSRFFR